jgi:hypothetical protein
MLNNPEIGQTICHGVDSLTKTTTLEPDAEVCAKGGFALDTGSDDDGDQLLDDDLSATLHAKRARESRPAETL